MQNRETGKTYKKSPMGGTPKPDVSDLVNRKSTQVPSAMEKLLTAYNNKAYANPYAPLVSGGSSSYETVDGTPHVDETYAAWLRNGNRIGYLGRDFSPNAVTYSAGIDNVGDPYRGVYDTEINTPLGALGYGYDGDTVGATFTPNEQTNYYIQALANLLNR